MVFKKRFEKQFGKYIFWEYFSKTPIFYQILMKMLEFVFQNFIFSASKYNFSSKYGVMKTILKMFFFYFAQSPNIWLDVENSGENHF